ncbi:MAG: gliding motility-associated C-terminal domain-containing protein [Ferruginibacter sp.]
MRKSYIQLLIFCLFTTVQGNTQQARFSTGQPAVNGFSAKKNIFSPELFINNIGQYGKRYSRQASMGEILYGYEGFGMPVLFTKRGIIYLHRSIKKYNCKQERLAGKKSAREEEIEKGYARDEFIAAVFVNASNKVKLIADSAGAAYFTYGLIKEKAYGYRRITYQEIYPHIDLVFHPGTPPQTGFEYTFIVRPGGNPDDIKIVYQGDIRKIIDLPGGHMKIRSGCGAIREQRPVCFISGPGSMELPVPVASSFKRTGNRIGFNIGSYDRSKTLYIDPFVSSTGTLTGANNGIAKDIDFDYDGNIYVAGGGDGKTSHKLAKYNAAGVLQWTFSGNLTTPSWSFGTSYGGWVVEKQTGKIFLGQGVINPGGSRVVRLNASGVFDNFITSASSNFSENWKMIWSCNNGQPQILIGGGTTASSNSIGICTPPLTSVDSRNITGSTAFYQDIADMIIDPLNNDMYSLFSTGIIPLNNRIYKHAYPYTASTAAWNTASGYQVLNEIRNRPYLASNAFGDNENSANILAVNSQYLFYWDGKHLKAFDKATGSGAGNPFVNPVYTPLMSGGIVADECNNVFIGNGDDTIKVLKFDGNSFDDLSVPDISLPGFPGTVIHDLAYDPGRHLLYACGDGVVASLDISGYCTAGTFSLIVSPDCNTQTVQAGISPAPPLGTVVTYILFSGTTQLQSNSSGLFNGLTPGTNYTIRAFINQACSGLQLVADFLMNNCVFSVAAIGTGPTCTGVANGMITATASYGTAPYLYAIDGINFQSSGIFTNLATGTYIVTVRDFTGKVINSAPVILDNKDVLNLTAQHTDLTCSLTNGTITAQAAGGVPPLQFSIDGIHYQAAPIFIGLPPGNYTVYVKDANQCMATATVSISVVTPPVLSVSVTPTSCNNASGSIHASTVMGSTPYQYSIDGINFQSSGLFSGLAKNNYTVTLKDAGGCMRTVPATVDLNNTLTVDAGNGITLCEGTTRQIPASSNGTSFTWSPATGLTNHQVLQPGASPGVTTIYTLTARDGICTGSSSTTVYVKPAPFADAGKDTTVCFGKNIQLNGSGGQTYHWKPATWLSNTSIADPVCIQPAAGIFKYALSVTAANGCSSVLADTVIITVKPPASLFAGNDTAVVINLPLQLQLRDVNNVGFSNYRWSPATGLNNTNIYNPVAVLNRDITYSVFAETPGGCAGTDTIQIKVYKGPIIYVPNTFTPNGDNLNDLLRALPVGIRIFKYFSVYNRYGQLVFKTADPRKGWDGLFREQQQPMGVYTWMVEGVDYRGVQYAGKGTVLLAR